MKISIEGEPKEIAALALELQGQPKKCDTNNAIQKQIDLVSKVSERCHNTSELCALSLALTELQRL